MIGLGKANPVYSFKVHCDLFFLGGYATLTIITRALAKVSVNRKDVVYEDRFFV